MIYSNPFVHTVYYFRKIYDHSSSETDILETAFLKAQNNDNATCVDFAFNENVGCSSVANGIFMRLNACSLLKLRHWCLNPTDSVAKKMIQYFAGIFLSPLAALIDLIVNVVLMVFKLSAWPVLRFAIRADVEATECLWNNLSWHCLALGESIAGLFSLIISLPMSFVGPRCASGWDTPLWAYRAFHYQGENFPHTVVSQMLPMPEASYEEMHLYYNDWFEQGNSIVILDPQRVHYLRSHCGWSLSNQQFKDVKLNFGDFPDSKIAFRLDAAEKELFLVVDVEYETSRETAFGEVTTTHKKLHTIPVAINSTL